MYTPEDHVTELVKAENIDEASAVYGREQVWFAQHAGDPETKALLDGLSDALEAKYEANLRTAMQGVKALRWPVARDAWPQVRSELKELADGVRVVSAVSLFKNEAYRPAVVAEAQVLLKDTTEKLRQGASAVFADYPLLTEPNFFDQYPVSLDAALLFAEQKAVVDGLMKKADAKGVLHLNAEYGDMFSTEEKTELANTYFGKACPNAKKAGLSTLLGAYAKAVQAGMELKSIPGVNVAFLEVTSDTLKKKGVIEFPVGVEMDMPFTAVNGDLKDGFEAESVTNADIVILFNLAATRTFRKVDTNNYVTSSYLAGYKQVHNPDWDLLEVELQQAQMEVLTVTNTANQSSTTSNNVYSGIGNVLSSISNAMAQSEAENKLEDLKKKIKTTPRYLEEPVYEPYQFQRVEMDVRKFGTVQYYIVDRRNKRYYSDFFDINSKEFFTVAYNLRESDPALDTYRKTNVTESIVDAFEQEPVIVKLSELLEHYSANKSKSRRFTSMAAIRKDIVKNRNIAVAKAKKEEYGFDKKEDKRFESVVAIRNSKSLGTGFYVTSDIVLTNYHVVAEQKFIELKKWGDKETFGKVIAKDVRLDLALVKVQDRGVPVTFYGKKNLSIGDTVEAIGHPHGHLFTLTRGVVSTIRKHGTVMRVQGKPVLFVQTDAPINPGNSGGPLFLGNKVIGVNDWVVSKEIAEGLNFSIHYSEVFKFLNDNHVAYKKAM